MNNFSLFSWKKALSLFIIALLILTLLPPTSLAQPEETCQNDLESSFAPSYDSEFTYAWSPDQHKFALAEINRVLILDTEKHTLKALELPVFPDLVRIILNLGFNPDGTKLFTISLLDEPDIDSNVMEIHLLTLDGKILTSQVVSNLAQANWLTDNLIELIIYKDLSGEEVVIKYWNLQKGEIID